MMKRKLNFLCFEMKAKQLNGWNVMAGAVYILPGYRRYISQRKTIPWCVVSEFMGECVHISHRRYDSKTKLKFISSEFIWDKGNESLTLSSGVGFGGGFSLRSYEINYYK